MSPRDEKIAQYIREHIRLAREDMGMSQEQLGNAVGKTNVTISDIERGKVGVSAVDLAQLAHVLERPLHYFFPFSVLIGVPREELKAVERELLHHFNKLDKYITLENTVIDLVKSLGNFASKSEIRRNVDEISKIVRGKD